MSKVLYIKANPLEDKDSLTFKLSNLFIAEYMRNNPGDEVKVLDLYKEDIGFLSTSDLEEMKVFGNRINNYAQEFASADKYVFAAPMWNLSFPAILKAYFDYVTLLGLTFEYTETGAVGLLKNKKAVHIVTRGGMYSVPPMNNFEMGDKYIRTLLEFIGVTDTKTIALELTNVLQGAAKEASIEEVEDRCIEFAKIF